MDIRLQASAARGQRTILNSVLNGKGQMPPWRGALSEDEVWAYIRATAIIDTPAERCKQVRGQRPGCAASGEALAISIPRSETAVSGWDAARIICAGSAD